MVRAAYFVPLAPLIAAVIVLFLGKRGARFAGPIASLGAGASFVLSSIAAGSLAASNYRFHRVVLDAFSAWPIGSYHVSAAFLLDPLSSSMILFITGVSTLIFIYSIGYMEHDEDKHKYFFYLSLFLFSMLVLVEGANLIVTFIGWEGVGLCSYLLISYWFERPAAASAGKKAMIVNRVGDAGLLAAMFLIFSKVHSLNYLTIFKALPSLPSSVVTAFALLVLAGAVGKSAQMPLVGWLPDAMEGPTPVSALIHAATMVTAGVYLLTRIGPALHLSPDAAEVVTVVGMLTAFFGATAGCAQDDIKRILAYSTVSQIGYMFVGVGTGQYVGAIFLMITHAFYKAGLFLGAGSVIHAMHEDQDIKRMGGLARLMPVTAVSFAIGWLSIGGVFPFSGFWSKGEVLSGAFHYSYALWVFGILTAVLTAYYMGREFVLVFLGNLRTDSSYLREHPPADPGAVMNVPVVSLAFLSAVGGLVGFLLSPWLSHYFEAVGYHPVELGGTRDIVLGVVDAVLALIGAFAALRLWANRVSSPVLEPQLLKRAWYYDQSIDALIARPSTRLSHFVGDVIEVRGIDRFVLSLPLVAASISSLVRKLASGYLRRYALVFSVGIALLAAYVAVRAL